jgi:hypothetical protein
MHVCVRAGCVCVCVCVRLLTSKISRVHSNFLLKVNQDLASGITSSGMLLNLRTIVGEGGMQCSQQCELMKLVWFCEDSLRKSAA